MNIQKSLSDPGFGLFINQNNGMISIQRLSKNCFSGRKTGNS